MAIGTTGHAMTRAFCCFVFLLGGVNPHRISVNYRNSNPECALSLTLGLLRAAGLLNVPMMLATGSPIAMRVIGYRPAMWLATWWHRKKQRKAKRKREALLKRWPDHQAAESGQG